SMFEVPTVAGLARVIEQAISGEPQAEAEAAIVAVGREHGLPLSNAQERLWFLDKLSPGTSAFNVPSAVRLRGSVAVAALAQSLGEVERRHEVLRTCYEMEAGQPVQRIQAASFQLALVDVSGLGESEREATLRRLAREEAGRAFDLSRGPMLRGH